MGIRIPWTQRRFSFEYPWQIYPEMIERVRGTPARAESLIRNLPASLLTRRIGDRWSIQENIAHLADLDEALFQSRIEEYTRGVATLHAADMTNVITNNANHNARTIGDVMERLRRTRAATISRLESFPSELFARTALHPRLQVQMRLVDLVNFNAEHDDYHMAHITDLKRELGSA